MRAMTFLILASVVSISACGGGGGGGSSTPGPAVPPTAAPPPPPPPPPAATGSPAGLYSGVLDGCGAGCPVDTTALIAENGEWFMRFEAYSNGVNWGFVTINDLSFDGNRDRYDAVPPFEPPKPFGFPPTGPAFLDDSTREQRTIEGTFNEGQSAQGSFSFNGQTGANYTLVYDDQFDRDSSLAILAGMYSATDMAGFTLTYVFDADGSVSGSDSTGCAVSGTVAEINTDFNMYRLDLSFNGCGIGADGDFSGNGTLIDSDAPTGESLFFYVVSEDETLLIVLELPRA